MRTSTRPQPNALARVIRGRVDQTFDLARRLARQHCPILGDDDTTDMPRPCAIEPVVGDVTEIDGASYGLAFLLAWASDLLDQPVKRDIVATGALRRNGTVEPVEPETISSKIHILQRVARHPMRLFVAVDQQIVAGSDLRPLSKHDLPPSWSLVSVSDVVTTIQEAFPTATCELERRWKGSPRVAAEMAEHILRMTLHHGRASASLQGIERTADILLKVLPSTDSLSRGRTQAAGAIARRLLHLEEPQPIDLRWTDNHRVPLGTRLALHAHALHTAVERGDDTDETLKAALHLIPDPVDDTTDHLPLLTAVGRWYAARLQFDEAWTHLQRSISSALHLHRPDLAAPAVAEALRVASLIKPDGVPDLEQLWWALKEVYGDPYTRQHARRQLVVGLLRARSLSPSRWCQIVAVRDFNAPPYSIQCEDTVEYDWALAVFHNDLRTRGSESLHQLPLPKHTEAAAWLDLGAADADGPYALERLKHSTIGQRYQRLVDDLSRVHRPVHHHEIWKHWIW